MELITNLITILTKTALSLGIFTGGLRAAIAADPDYAAGKIKRNPVIAAIIYMVMAACTIRKGSPAEELWDSLFWSSLALAAFCDFTTTEIYDFCFLPAAISGCALLIFNSLHGVRGLIIFGAAQLLIFRKLYGGADCLAFFFCAAYITACGGGLTDCFLLMLYVFIILALVQLAKGNVKKGNLKECVPLIPYIAAVMLISLEAKKWFM